MDIKERKKDSTMIIELNGRLDATNSASLQEKLMSLAAAEKTLVINCEGLSFISSSGLRIFMLIAKKMKSEHSHFALCSLSENVKEIFELSGLSEIFPTYPGENEALDAMKIFS
jgi:anti-sigma B factor antagonist